MKYGIDIVCPDEQSAHQNRDQKGENIIVTKIVKLEATAANSIQDRCIVNHLEKF